MADTIATAGAVPATSKEAFLADVLEGLSGAQKSLPCKYLYDERGSQLFEEICELDEYYPTRTELAIMHEYVSEIAEGLNRDTVLVELGSGSSLKTRLLLDHAPSLGCYVPMDISGEHLHATAETLAREYPDIEVIPVCADYTQPFELPGRAQAFSRRIVYFPGSTIGNFPSNMARTFLDQMRKLCGPEGAILIGVDLDKPHHVLEAAYNDAKGVTAAFNLNLLRRVNRELDDTFNLDHFRHHAFYNGPKGRVEMHLVSTVPHTAQVAGQVFLFRQGETIHTESSHKYSLHEFAHMADQAGLRVDQVWTDPSRYFSVQKLAPV